MDNTIMAFPGKGGISCIPPQTVLMRSTWTMCGRLRVLLPSLHMMFESHSRTVHGLFQLLCSLGAKPRLSQGLYKADAVAHCICTSPARSWYQCCCNAMFPSPWPSLSRAGSSPLSLSGAGGVWTTPSWPSQEKVASAAYLHRRSTCDQRGKCATAYVCHRPACR